VFAALDGFKQEDSPAPLICGRRTAAFQIGQDAARTGMRFPCVAYFKNSSNDGEYITESRMQNVG